MNTERKLDALIDALGFDIEVVDSSIKAYRLDDIDRDGDPYTDAIPMTISKTDYKLTRKKYNSKPSLHKIIREYENEGMSASEMIGRIMLMEGIAEEDL